MFSCSQPIYKANLWQTKMIPYSSLKILATYPVPSRGVVAHTRGHSIPSYLLLPLKSMFRQINPSDLPIFIGFCQTLGPYSTPIASNSYKTAGCWLLFIPQSYGKFSLVYSPSSVISGDISHYDYVPTLVGCSKFHVFIGQKNLIYHLVI